MEKNKKKAIIIIDVLLVFIVILTLVLAKYVKDRDNDNVKPPHTPSIVTDEIKRLSNDDVHFSLQSLINDYYNSLLSNENKFYNLLDPSYIKDNNITKDNYLQIIKNDFESTSYIATEIYYNPDSSVTYYFIKGYLIDTPIFSGTTKYYKDINYLVIVNENNNYVVRPLGSITNLYNYASGYAINNVIIDNKNIFNINSTSIRNKLTVYINEFLNMLYYDLDRAYNMLDDDMKEKYPNVNILEQEIDNISSKLSTSIYSYGELEKDKAKVYEIYDKKQNKIKITENNIMDYKISFDIS